MRKLESISSSTVLLIPNFSEPGVMELPLESGKIIPDELLNILTGIFKENDVVGLTVAEYLLWDAKIINTLSELDIFKY